MDHPLYLWIKSLHIIAVTAWMAGLFYLPRLFVYHCEVQPGTPESERFKVMERRLLRAIMNPSMIATWLFGLTLLVMEPGWLQGQGWLHAKVLLVLGLSGVHGVLAKHRKAFAADQRPKPQRYYRILNEVPTLLLIGIVILVVVKPF